MLVRKEGVGGGEHLPRALRRGRKPGQGSCCSSFFVIPSCANLASASWQVGSWLWPSQITARAGTWLEIWVREGSPQADSLGST